MDIRIDGFRVDAVQFIFEDKELRDEPRTYLAGATPRDYGYLNHIYTINQESNYELLGNWKIYIDQYADQLNESQSKGQ